MLDPCAGLDGRLTAPWRAADSALTVHSYELCHGTDFFEAPAHEDVDLCIFNPPFAWGGPNPGRKHASEEFPRKVLAVPRPGTPIVMITPVGFRLNVRRSSKRLAWVATLPITGIVSLPHDCFGGVLLACEIILLNLPQLAHHYVCAA
jgi:hypothetical protein